MSQPSCTSETSLDQFTVLVVDDDSTSLSIVAAILKSWKYNVMTMKSPFDALATVRTKANAISLVVTDFHMPEMNGIELQQQINAEIDLPVIIISSDDRETVVLRCLASGVVFYIVKPLNPEDLKNIWQYAVGSKKGKSIFIEGTGSNEGSFLTKKKSSKDISSAASVNEDKKRKNGSQKRKSSKEAVNPVAAKKAKVAWTNSLHDCFLKAIRHITLEKAVPKKILEFMNVPSLTRENVASHLQKYRLFLRKVAELGIDSSKKWAAERALRSRFALGRSSTTLGNVEDYEQIRKKRQMGTSSFQAGYGGNLLSTINATNIGSSGFPSSGASSSNDVSQAGLLDNQTSFQYQSLSGNKNFLYPANQATYDTGLKGIETDLLSCVSMSEGLLKLYQQKSQTRSDLYGINIGASSLNRASGWKRSFGAGYESMEALNDLYSIFEGINLNDAEKFVGTGQTSQNANVLNGDCGLPNETAGNQDMTAGFTGNIAFPYSAPGECSSSLFDKAFAGANQEAASPSVPPPLSQQQYGLGNNGQSDFTFGQMNNAPVFGNIAHSTEKLSQVSNVDDLPDELFDLTDFQFRDRQQGGGDVWSANFPNSSYQAELNLKNNQPQVPHFSIAYGIVEHVPWIEPTLEELLETEDVTNPDLGSNAHSLNGYSPSLSQNPNTQHQGCGNYINLVLNGRDQTENSSSASRACVQFDSEDEFFNCLVGDHPL